MSGYQFLSIEKSHFLYCSLLTVVYVTAYEYVVVGKYQRTVKHKSNKIKGLKIPLGQGLACAISNGKIKTTKSTIYSTLVKSLVKYKALITLKDWDMVEANQSLKNPLLISF